MLEELWDLLTSVEAGRVVGRFLSTIIIGFVVWFTGVALILLYRLIKRVMKSISNAINRQHTNE